MKLLLILIGLACVLPALSQESRKKDEKRNNRRKNQKRNPSLGSNDIGQEVARILSRNPFLPDIPSGLNPKIISGPIAKPYSTNPFFRTNSPSNPQNFVDASLKSCRGPNQVVGVCTPLLNCQPLVTRLRQERDNPSFIDLLRQSNAICGNEYAVVCCPTANQGQSQQLTRDIPTRLPTMQEGCGSVRRSQSKASEQGFFKIQVVGGTDSKIGSWPWIALLGYDDGVSTSPFKCGGALITSRHILTAAHCIRSDLTFVRLGEHDLSTDTEAKHIDVPVRKVLRHPQYNRRDGRNDIALVYLSQNVPTSDNIRPICLPTTPELRTKSFVDFSPFVAGWGRTLEGGQTATVLQELQIPIHKNSVCEDLYRRQNLLISEQQFDDSVLCAGVLSGGKDTCQGDSGGPLMIPVTFQQQMRHHMVGIVSYSIGCARPDVLGAYTRVAKFIDWIQTGLTDTS